MTVAPTDLSNPEAATVAPPRPVKLAIVGCGAITRSAHLPAALRSASVDVYALVDVFPDNARKLVREYALSCNVTKDLAEVIGEVEGVLIATPNHTHAAIAEVALTRGVPTLIEKPLTTRYEDAVRLCEMADRHGTFISVGFRSRHWTGVRLLKTLLEDGCLGRIHGFSYEVGNTGSWNAVSGFSVQAEQAGGGVLIDAHILDKLVYWFGEPSGFQYADDNHGGVEANCKGVLSYDNGDDPFRGSFFISKTIELKNRIVIRAERYVCSLDEREDALPVLEPRDLKGFVFVAHPPGLPAGEPATRKSFQLQLEEFAANVRQRGTVTVDGWFAAKSVKWTEAMYQNRQQLDEPWAVVSGN
jgi:predicted dehydrogenase